MDKVITLVIPTKNRPEFIKRVLFYYSSSKYDGIILILDSSNYTNTLLIKDIIKNYNNLDIKYKNDDLDQNSIVLKYLYMIETKYVSLLADDDLILNNSIAPITKFLNENHKYCAAGGNSYKLYIHNKINSKAYGKITKIVKYELYNTEYYQVNKRIVDFIRRPKNINMLITRTEVFKNSWNEISNIPTYQSLYVFGELIQGLNVVICGKIKKLNINYLIRQAHNDAFYSKLDKVKLVVEGNIICCLNYLNIFIRNNISDKNEIYSLLHCIIGRVLTLDKKNIKSNDIRKYFRNMRLYAVLRIIKYELLRKKIQNIKDEDMRFYLNSIYH